MSSLKDKFNEKFPKKNNTTKNTTSTQNINEETSQFPNSYENANMEDRQYQWATRWLSIALIATTFLSVALICTIFSLLPLKTVEPLTVERGNGDAILAKVEKINGEIGGPNLIAEDYSMMYVIYRHEIVRSDEVMRDRWLKGGFIEAMSSQPEYTRFYNANASILKEIRQADNTIEVHLDGDPITLSPVKNNQTGTYQVKFTLITRNNTGAEIARRHFIATLEAGFVPYQKIPDNQREQNPVGFKVVNYTIADRSSLTDTLKK